MAATEQIDKPLPLETSARNSKCELHHAPLRYGRIKTIREDTRWLRLTDRNVGGGNIWLWAMRELGFVGAAMIWAALSTLFR